MVTIDHKSVWTLPVPFLKNARSYTRSLKDLLEMKLTDVSE